MAKLRHIAITVPDMEATATFYEKSFGMERTGQSEIAITLSDGVGGLAIGTVNVTESPVNDAPVVNLNGADGATFTEGGASVFVDDDLLVSDLDSATLSGATVTIENIANPGAEILSANTAGTAITASFDAGAGVLTLSGNAPPATYQQVLRTVTYQNQSDHPTSGGNAQRSIRFVVNDGIAASAAAIGLVAVAPVNDAPVNDMPGAQTKPSAAPLVFSADNNNSISIADLDVGGATLRVTLSVSDGTLSLGQTTGLAFSVGDGTADATMTFTGTLANVNAALNGLAYDAAGFAGEATLTITTSDLGNTGAPGALAASDTVTIRVEGDVVIGDQTLIVGDSGPANFVIDGGETLTVAGAVVGNQAAGDGTLTVSGPASALNVASAPEVGDGSLTVGLLGTGTVEVLNGGLVSAENATLGLETGSSGTLNLAGGSSFNLVATSALLLVGKNGEGTLLVEGSSQVAIDGLAGVFPGIEIAGDAAEDTGTGSVTVTGEGSQITFAGDTPFLQVGRSGIGNLNVLNGGFVGNATFLSIGRLAGGFGTVNLSGPQSTILLTGIASAAAAAEFPVVSAGDGPFLNVGALGTGILNITGGATFRIETDEILAVNGDAGFNVGGSSAFPGGNGALLVDGMNTQLLVDANETFFGVGSNDGTGAMTVSGGGQVVLTGSAFAVIGRGGDGLLTVDGNGSLLQLGEPGAVDAGLRVGDAGGSGTFIVSGGAHFNTFFLEIGRNGGTGAATFTDPGTTVVLSEQFGNFAAPFQNEGGFLRVARDAGDVGFLNVLNQAVVELTAGTGFSAPGLEIARNPGSSGTVLVDNATINISQAGAADPFLGGPFLQVGRAGAGTMTIRNGGEVRLTGDQAFVQVSRGNANEFADPATAPILAPSALEILSGGKLLVDGIAGPAGLIIGQEANGNGNVLVSGVGSLFSVAPSDHSQLFIGLRGDGTLAITDGGLVTGAELVFVGLDPGSMGSLIVSGPDSRLVATDVEVVQGTLEVMAGGAISGIFLAAGRVAGSDGTMILDGPDSIVELSGVLGDAAFLNVGRGGTGHLEVTKGAKILIDGQDGIQPGFQVGRDTGSNGTMVVSGPGSEVAISSLLTDFNAGYIAIGRSGIGDLQILDGGTVSNAPTGVTLIGGDITEDTGGTPGTGTVLVQGTAPGEVTPARISTLNAGAWLLVGEDFNFFTGEPAGEGTGGTGTLTIGEFGTVVAGTVVIGTGGTVQGTGDLGARSENASFEFGSIEVHGGTLAPGFSAGTLHLDGNVTFAAGRLEIELGGAGAGLSDLIEVAGEAELLGGLIDVALIDGYLPQAGQSVVFLSAGQGLNADLDDLAVAVHGVARDFDFMLERDGNEIAFTALNDARAGNGSIFLGGNADDVFLGGAGDDLLVGGGGADRLTGGAGADIFVLGAGDGGATLDLADLLTDFEDGLDLIGLEGGLSFADLTISGAATGGSAVSLTASGEILALVQGVSQDLLDSNDFTTAV